MIYALLVIIAIGVLLASTEGKKFLRLLTNLAVIGGVLYLAFWIIIIIYSYLNTKFTSQELIDFFYIGLFFGILIIIGFFLSKLTDYLSEHPSHPLNKILDKALLIFKPVRKIFDFFFEPRNCLFVTLLLLTIFFVFLLIAISFYR